MAKAGAETWSIAGRKYQIDSTYFLGLPDGLQYTIDYALVGPADSQGLSDQRAFEIAEPLMRHAVEHKLYERVEIKKDGVRAPVARIGASLFRRDGVRTSGYRVSRTLTQLQSDGTGSGKQGAP